MKTTKQNSRFGRAVTIFKQHGGILRTTQALRAGIHPSTLYTMRDVGTLEVVSRGVFRLAGSEQIGNPDLVTVATRVPKGVIFLISALVFHELTTQIPHEIHVALKRGAESPRLTYPPVKIYWIKGQAFTEGVETHRLDGVDIRIYNQEKTLADCFKFRNKIGLDIAVEAVRFYRERKSVNVDALMRYASICRVEKVMRPYLEAIL